MAVAPGPRPVRTLLQTQVIAGAIAFNPVIYLIVGVVVNTANGPILTETEGAIDTVLSAVIVAAIAIGMAGFWLRGKKLSPEAAGRLSGGDTMAYYLRWTVVGLVMAEAPAVSGLAHYLLKGNMLTFAGVAAVSIALGLCIFPTQGHYDEMCAGLETLPDFPADRGTDQ